MRIAPSSLGRLEACPGSYNAERQCGYSQGSPAAAEGNLLHSAMRTPNLSELNLTFEQKRLVETAKDHARELLLKHLPGHTRWWAEVSAVARLDDRHTVSGKLDWIGYDETGTLIIDWKFGRTPVDVAADNLQLRAYAIIGHDFQGPRTNEQIVVALVQPTVERELQVTQCTYTPEDVAFSRKQLVQIADLASDPNAAREPGEHCRYCKALGTALCPESVEVASSVAKFSQSEILPRGEELAEWLDRAKVAEQLIDLLRSHAREEIAAGREVPGWTVTRDQEIRTLPDAVAAWERVAERITPEDFMRICKVGVGDLQELLAKRLGWPSKAAKQEFNELMGAAIVIGMKRGALQKVRA